jgi:CheY-like chemotaxis protein
MERWKVLLVDDDPTVTSFVSYILESKGQYEVRSLNDPFRAVAAARDFRPDLLIMDISMPGKDGGEVAAEIAKDAQLVKVPIIFLSASVSKNDPQTVRNPKTGHIYLPKPVEPRDLMRCVENTLAGKKP